MAAEKTPMPEKQDEGLTDLHQHLLWGMDDGARDMEESLAMLEEAARQGIAAVAATPHAIPGVRPFDAAAYEERLNLLREAEAARGLHVALLSGAEIAYTGQTASALCRGLIPTLGGGEHVLIELWHDITWRETREAVCELLRAGYFPILAHVERYACFVLEPKKALALRGELEVRYQVNAGTFLRKQSVFTRRFLRIMMERGGFDLMASDAHGARRRVQNLRAGYEAAAAMAGYESAERLTHFSCLTR